MAANSDDAIFRHTPPQRAPTYRRIFRERNTMWALILGVALVVGYLFVYPAIHASLLNQVKWPKLQSSKVGLVVLGLQDKDRPGWQHRYEARESNHSWQIRYNEEYNGPSHSIEQDDASETKDPGANNPGATHHTNSGAVVPMPELMRECPAVLNASSFTSAGLEENVDNFTERPYYVVHLNLSDEGSSRYWQFSNIHDGERLAFVLNNDVITCPSMDKMYVSSLTIDPIWIKADAQKLVDFINGQKTK